MIPSRTIAPACPCFSTSSLAGLHSSVRSKQLIENRISFFPILNHFYLAPVFHLNYVLWSHSSSVVWKGVLLSSPCVCCSLGSQWDLLEKGAPAWVRPRRTKSDGNTAQSNCQRAEKAPAPALSFGPMRSSIFI